MSPETTAPGRGPLIGYYLLLFAAIGVTLPFLPAYLKSLNLSVTEIGMLLAIGPIMAVLVPPLWGQIADRSGRPDRVLSLLSLAAAACFVPMLFARSFGPLLAILCGYSLFASSITTVLDSMTLHKVALEGGDYSRIRVFGSVGFVIASAGFGLAVNRVDVTTVVIPLVLLGAAGLWSFTLRARSAPGQQAVNPFAGFGLIRTSGLGALLVATCLHWVACAPWNGTLAIHVTALGLRPWVVGVSAALGVVAEIVAMFLYPSFSGRIAPRHLLFVSFVASALRWAGMAIVSSAWAIVALSLLHGLTFGAFYIAAITYVARRVPSTRRATGQALFVSITFGVGGLSGLLASGVGYDAFGGRWLFAIAAVIELLAAAVALGLRPATEAPPAGIPEAAPPSQA